jgi:hypothetical protein
MKADSDRVRM